MANNKSSKTGAKKPTLNIKWEDLTKKDLDIINLPTREAAEKWNLEPSAVTSRRTILRNTFGEKRVPRREAGIKTKSVATNSSELNRPPQQTNTDTNSVTNNDANNNLTRIPAMPVASEVVMTRLFINKQEVFLPAGVPVELNGVKHVTFKVAPEGLLIQTT